MIKLFNKFYIWTVLIVFYVLFIISLGVSIYLIEQTATKFSDDYKTITNSIVVKLNLLDHIRKNTSLADDAILKHVFYTDDSRMILQEERIIASKKENDINLNNYKKLITTQKERALFIELVNQRNKTLQSISNIIDLSKENKDNEANKYYHTFYIKEVSQLSDILADLIKTQIAKTYQDGNITNTYLNHSVSNINFFIGFLILLIFGIGFLIYNVFIQMMRDNKTIYFQKNLAEVVIESAPDGIIGLNQDDEIVLFNQQAEIIFGYDRAEVLHKKCDFLYKTTPNNIIEIGIRKNGAEFPIEINKSNIKNNRISLLCSVRDNTEKNKIVQKLKDNEEKFRNVFEGSHDAIILFDGVNYLDCNIQALRIFGVKSPKDFIQFKPEDFSPEFQANGEKSSILAKEIIQKTLETGYYQYEWLNKSLDGKLFYTEILLTSYFIQNKKIIQASIRDISERKKTEKLLDDINKAVSVKTGKNYFSELTHFIIEHLKVKYVFIGNYIPEKESIETISFRDKNGALDNFVYELEDTPCQIALSTNTFCCYPNAVQTQFPKDLDLINLNVESYLGINLIFNGKTEGIIVLMDDKPMDDFEEKMKLLSIITTRTINELKRRNIILKLKESKEFNKGVLSSLSSHIAVIDNTGDILTVNKAWKQFASQNGGDLIEKTNKNNNYLEVCKKAAANGDKIAHKVLMGIKKIFNKKIKEVTIEYPCHSPIEKRWFVFKAMPFGKSNNKIVITHQDVTSRKLSEQKQKLQNLELKKTNSELDQFVYSISHDLRAPLTSILGLIDLSYQSDAQESPILLDMMKQSVIKLDNLITDILIYSRNKNTVVKNEEIDFQKAIDATRENHLFMNGTEAIAIHVNISQKAPFISDKIRINYILNNLYCNAIKYSDVTKNDSFINITICTDQDKAVIIFEDNGIGIAQSDTERIFEMFYRSTNLSTGSGLGLYIVKEAVSKMKGKIDIKSEEKLGTQFTITLPNLKKP